MATKDGGPAFPSPETDSRIREDGMSLRDWFAGQALAGMNAAGTARSDEARAEWARDAYRLADAMLLAREGK